MSDSKEAENKQNDKTNEDRKDNSLPQILPDDFRVGEKDNAGEKVVKIYVTSKDFVVYRTQHTIRLEIDKNCGKLNKYTAQHEKLGIQLARIYSRLPEDLSGSEPLNRQIARAINLNVSYIQTEGSSSESDVDEILNSVEQQIKYQRTTNARIAYFLSSLILPILISITAFISFSWDTVPKAVFNDYITYLLVLIVGFHIKNTTWQGMDIAEFKAKAISMAKGIVKFTFDIFYKSLLSIFFVTLLPAILVLIAFSIHGNTTAIEYVKVMFFGSLGGVFSVATSYASLEIDLDAPNFMNVLVGISRIVISVLGAIFMYLAIKSGIVLNSDAMKTSTPYFTYLFVMLAGFSEKLVPNIMHNLSGKVTEENSNTTHNPPKKVTKENPNATHSLAKDEVVEKPQAEK